MDLSKTVEFILEQQAAMTTRQDSIIKMIEGGMKLIAGHDRQIKALIEAQQTTDHRLDRLVEAQQTTDHRLDRLVEAQQTTDHKLDRLIEALLRNTSNNGPQPT